MKRKGWLWILFMAHQGLASPSGAELVLVALSEIYHPPHPSSALFLHLNSAGWINHKFQPLKKPECAVGRLWLTRNLFLKKRIPFRKGNFALIQKNILHSWGKKNIQISLIILVLQVERKERLKSWFFDFFFLFNTPLSILYWIIINIE